MIERLLTDGAGVKPVVLSDAYSCLTCGRYSKEFRVFVLQNPGQQMAWTVCGECVGKVSSQKAART